MARFTTFALAPYLVVLSGGVATGQPDDATRWGGQHFAEALEHALPLPEPLPSDKWPSLKLEWRAAFQVVPPWTAAFSGTLIRRQDGPIELRAKCLLGGALWKELGRLHQSQPATSLAALLPQLRFKEVTLLSRDEPKVRQLANELETVALKVAPPQLQLFNDGVRYKLRVEATPFRTMSITGGPEDAALAAWVEQLRGLLGMRSE
jgi:hypothetical protein